jgi:hypothetical protein
VYKHLKIRRYELSSCGATFIFVKGSIWFNNGRPTYFSMYIKIIRSVYTPRDPNEFYEMVSILNIKTGII